ncbi:unnamed protein product [Vitrella brassicaformis CCMP3155]|uniref:Dienelactone hydrolase domain-containing protein n=2 Tax=Vitrella brassicaformis TaxID=1169539 RepID=A0A0G4G300_VITBC|nr:unnamed protein product [Vitrella brassicaformis CCMP3155]|mmetsp:Transcript_47278/g.118056  ORF Transcript_47278/g.118056 Transcript_47278/m.118056 type:complete len:242 (+) Transcript_47278:83-808(+)|eukprot:CEM22606.1 unnamed protein product [Vitrella brassicaformis CCMP3155]
MSGVIKVLEGFEKVVFNGITGYMCGAKASPGVIVLQEWWGVTDEIQRQAEHIAKQGYSCLVPDLYKGKLGVDAEEAQHLMSNLDFPQAVSEIKASVDYIKQEGSKKVGVTGFCMGGALTIATAVKHSSDISCAVPFYGIPDAKFFDPSQITCPVQAHFGEDDKLVGFSDPTAVEAFKAAMGKGQCADFQLHTYKGVGHAFMNGMVPEWQEKKTKLGFGEHRQEVVDLAFTRTFEWFQKYLK